MNRQTIKRNNQEIFCDLTCSERETIHPKFWLRTSTEGKVNNYEISARICGLDNAKESSLYFIGLGVKFMGNTTNEETLIESAILDIFAELTQENY